jgi:hypothetical protein
MKKAISVFLFVVVGLSMVGCSNLSVTGVNDSRGQTVGNSTVHFNIDLNNVDQSSQPAGLSKIGDGLTFSERQANLAYRKAKVKSISIVFYRTVNQDGSASPTYIFRFPVNNGVVSGDMEVLSGKYDEIMITTNRDTNEKVLMCSDFLQIIRGYTIDAGANALVIKLQQNQALPAHIVIDVPSGSGFIEGASYRHNTGTNDFVNGEGSDLVFSKGQLVWNCSVYIAKRTSSYIVGGKELQSFFDVNKIIDDDTVEMTAQMPQLLSLNISFADDSKIVVDSVFPADGAINVPTDINAVFVWFSKNIADFSQMPGAQLGVASEDGTDQVAGTYGFNDKLFCRSLAGIEYRIYLKPNTKYIAHVSGVKDAYGNEMVGEKRWSFTTGN